MVNNVLLFAVTSPQKLKIIDLRVKKAKIRTPFSKFRDHQFKGSAFSQCHLVDIFVTVMVILTTDIYFFKKCTNILTFIGFSEETEFWDQERENR